MIKAIAFDLIRVFIKVKDVVFTPLEFTLADNFDYKICGELFWDWAVKQTGKSLVEIKEICWRTINKIYEIRQPDIFARIQPLKFATASNHLSMIKDWLKKEGFYDQFYCHVVSEDVKCQKPDLEFYQVLIKSIGEKPEEILFIDDHIRNIEAAQKAGFATLLYDGKELLSNEVNSYLNA